MLKQLARRVSPGLLFWIMFVFGLAFAPLRWEISLATGLWAGCLAVLDMALVFLLCADYLTKCKLDLKRADPDYLIMSLFQVMDPEKARMIQNSRIVVDHIILNGNRVDKWSWYGSSRQWDEADVMAVWQASTVDYMAPITTWPDGTTRRQVCEELTNYFSVCLFCEPITQGKLSYFLPGGYAKAFRSITKAEYQG